MRILALYFLLACAVCGSPETIPLWPNGAPGARGDAPEDVPTLTAYLPENPGEARAAVVICPGGGYGRLANHEGEHYARFLNEHGIAAFVLQYRLGSAGYRHPVMLGDAARAMRLVRARAQAWNVDPAKVAIMGSSAGGHLAATVLTHHDPGDAAAVDPVERFSSRPDLGILCYAVITLGEFTHQGSKRYLLGDAPDDDLVKALSGELSVTAETPPCFIWHTWEDPVVPVENSLQFADALRRNGVPFALHVYPDGAHGIGLGTREMDPAKRHPWTGNLVFWLRGYGWVE